MISIKSFDMQAGTFYKDKISLDEAFKFCPNSQIILCNDQIKISDIRDLAR